MGTFNGQWKSSVLTNKIKYNQHQEWDKWKDIKPGTHTYINIPEWLNDLISLLNSNDITKWRHKTIHSNVSPNKIIQKNKIFQPTNQY